MNLLVYNPCIQCHRRPRKTKQGRKCEVCLEYNHKMAKRKWQAEHRDNLVKVKRPKRPPVPVDDTYNFWETRMTPPRLAEKREPNPALSNKFCIPDGFEALDPREEKLHFEGIV